MTQPKTPASELHLSLFDGLVSAADPLDESNERPTDLRQRWQGMIEIRPEEVALPVATTAQERTIYLSADQADGDVIWSPDGLGVLQAVMNQDEPERALSAGHEFIIAEGIERGVMQTLGHQLEQFGVLETTISAVLMEVQARLSPLEDLSGRALNELARYRMRDDASALARLQGHPDHWPLIITSKR